VPDLEKDTAALPGHNGERAAEHEDHGLVVHTAGEPLAHYHLPGRAK